MPIYVKVNGASGPFPGEYYKGRVNRPQWIEVLAVSFNQTGPRDVSTGMASGKRQHHPFHITKVPGVADPPLFNAVVTNEKFQSVQIDFCQGLAPIYSLTLLNPTITHAGKHFVPGKGDLTEIEWTWEKAQMGDGSVSKMELERIELAFTKISASNVQGGKTAADDWTL